MAPVAPINGKAKIQTPAIADAEHDVSLLSRFEVWSFGLHRITADGQTGGDVLANTAAGEMVNLAGLSIGDGNVYVRHCSPGRVGHCAYDGRFLGEHMERAEDE